MTALGLRRVEAAGFSGSYDPGDVTFLLRPLSIAATGVAEKERLIQTGQRHYSEMISSEHAPSPAYTDIYRAALDAGAARMGQEVAGLAAAVARDVAGPITLASLVRAGVPLGVLLVRALRRMGRDAVHFGVSIIRDRGLDQAALAQILRQRPAAGVVFVDGWTGKGVIAGELERSLTGSEVEPRLVVLADPCGRAWLAASGDDWLIPSGMLGATVSGLVSRTILDPSASGTFHGCMSWHHLAPFDVSQTFVNEIWSHVEAWVGRAPPSEWTRTDRQARQARAAAVVESVALRFNVQDVNHVKPGIAEATRVLLRRVPHRVLVRSPDDPEVRALLHLARDSAVPVEVAPEIGPYRAITLIRKVA